MKYDFDEVIERRNTSSVKWDLGDEQLLPLWVADMDFKAPAPVVKALKNRAEHGIYGYSISGDGYFDAMCRWWKNRHSWDINKSWIHFSPGVVPGINLLLKTFTVPGDKVIIQVPVYHPFYSAVRNNNCELVENPLIFDGERYLMDYEDLEKKASDPKVKLLILCSPHNPVGRVWTKEELSRLGEICLKHNVLVIADEIHCDLVYKEYTHTPFASISEEFLNNTITCVAPSKTFNIAGLQASAVIIADQDKASAYKQTLSSLGLPGPNVFAIEAVKAAYNEGDEWLDQLMEYLKGNFNFLNNYVEENLPMLKVLNSEGTYLVWVNCSGLGMSSKELHKFFIKEARVWFNEGSMFGMSGEDYVRINIACPRSILAAALARIKKAVNERI
jgi:cysteine-S-conjugate beta-lyase